MMGAKMNQPYTHKQKNQKGMAMIESISLVIVFLTLFWYSIGFWGVIHTAILNSIAARTYAFETFRHRSHLWHFRSRAIDTKWTYHTVGARLHGTNTDATPDSAGRAYATERRLAMFNENEPQGRSTSEHMNARSSVQDGKRNNSVSLDPVWVLIQVGICLNASCGD